MPMIRELSSKERVIHKGDRAFSDNMLHTPDELRPHNETALCTLCENPFITALAVANTCFASIQRHHIAEFRCD